MSLYAIGDLHLAYQSEPKFSVNRMGKIWENHEAILKENCMKEVGRDDTLVLVGDLSFAKKLPETELDFQYIDALPGKKVFLRGNHDMYWQAKKTARLNEQFKGRFFFLQGNYYPYGDYALVGTKGYCYEGKDTLEHAQMLVEREAKRLQDSFAAARADGFRKFIMFLHYPPTNVYERNSVFTKMAEHYGVDQVVYAHCHGEARFHDSIRGKKRGIRYSLVSGDCLRWHPQKIL